MTKQLSNNTLAQRLPYERAGVRAGIVHLGVGAFHRAHQAVYVDDVIADDPHWGICGVSLRRPDMRDAMTSQDGLYIVGVRGPTHMQTRIIGSILDVRYAPEDRSGIVAAMSDPAIRIVSLTITEKGYCHDPASGDLNRSHPDVMHDLQTPQAPITAIGFIVAALAKRRQSGNTPFTVLNCDNLPENGTTLKKIALQYAVQLDPALADWICAEVSFPSTMVDRIVPATTDDDRKLIAQSAGFEDAVPVITEPFTQWVVEDNFCNARPDLAVHGVEMVADVKPFENMKLRMLNGSHSTLAYLGFLMGHDFVADAISQPTMRAFVTAMMKHEVMPTLNMPSVDLDQYIHDLVERFANPGLQHRTDQIAMDGSQKLPQRLLGTIRDARAMGLPHERLLCGVASWIRYITGRNENGNRYQIKDPLAEYFSETAKHLPDVGRYTDAILDMDSVFGSDLRADKSFRADVHHKVRCIFVDGATTLVSHFSGLNTK